MTSNSPNAQWWHCHHEIEKIQRIDALCYQGIAQGFRVAVLATPEQLISNLSVKENIELPQAWHNAEIDTDNPLIADAIDQCLQRSLRINQTLAQLIPLQGASLSSNQRRWIGVARALYLQANWLVLDDDEKNLYPFEDERLQLLTQYLPNATVHWVSLRAPSTLPEHWVFAETGVNA